LYGELAILVGYGSQGDRAGFRHSSNESIEIMDRQKGSRASLAAYERKGIDEGDSIEQKMKAGEESNTVEWFGRKHGDWLGLVG